MSPKNKKPLFEQSIPIDKEKVAQIIKKHWSGLTLGKCVKESQNHTYEATDSANNKLIVRITPDPEKEHQNRVVAEIALVNYLSKETSLKVCMPRVTAGGEYIVREENLIIIVSDFAEGSPVDYMSYKWLTDEKMIKAIGLWLGHFHQYSMDYAAKQEQKKWDENYRNWDQLHQGIMADSDIDSKDQKLMDDVSEFGIIHGDVNVSNYFYDAEKTSVMVFDWDQCCQGWFLYDLAQIIFGPYMIRRSGSLFKNGEKVEQAQNTAQFTHWLVEAYETGRNDDLPDCPKKNRSSSYKVDWEALERMVMLRRSFYEKFCRRAQDELPEDNGMTIFMKFVVAWFDREKADKTDPRPTWSVSLPGNAQ